MTPGEFREFAKTMKEFGLTKLKMGDVEISAEFSSQSDDNKTYRELTPVQSPVKESDPIQHKAEQLSSLLKLSDTELVDHLFPDHTDAEESA